MASNVFTLVIAAGAIVVDDDDDDGRDDPWSSLDTRHQADIWACFITIIVTIIILIIAEIGRAHV